MSTKKPEYIYDIIIGENGITTHRGYKNYLEKEFQKIPGSENIVDTKNITIREFKEKTRSVFNWSVHTAKPECRHFVRIFDETTSTKAYKNPRLRIEDYFFKKEYKMSYSEFKEISGLPIDHIIRDKKNKTGIASTKSSSKQFNKNDCKRHDRKSMPPSWRKICEGLERYGALR